MLKVSLVLRGKVGRECLSGCTKRLLVRCCVFKDTFLVGIHFYWLNLCLCNVFLFLKLWWWNQPGWKSESSHNFFLVQWNFGPQGEMVKEKHSPSSWVIKSLVPKFSGDTYNANNDVYGYSEGIPLQWRIVGPVVLTMIDCLELKWPLFCRSTVQNKAWTSI